MESCHWPGEVQPMCGQFLLEEHIFNIYMLHNERKHMKLWKIGQATYCGITLKWNYTKHHVDLAMPAYFMKQLTKYSHGPPLKPQHCLYSPNPIKYAKYNQSPSPLDKSPWLDKAKQKRIQQMLAASSTMRKQWILLYKCHCWK